MWRPRCSLLLIAYLAILAVSVLGPSPGPWVGKGVGEAHRIEAAARTASGGGSTASISRQGLVRGLSADDMGNIALFIPFGVLLPAAVPQLRRWTVLTGAALSAGIELTQLVFLSWRVSSVRDVLFNTLGTGIGLAALVAAAALLRRRRGSGAGAAPAAAGTLAS